MASIFPFPPSKTTFHSKAAFHPKCHLHLSQCPTTSENSTCRTEPVPHLHLPPSLPHASLRLRCQPLSISCISSSQKAPPAPGQRRGCLPWMGLTAGSCVPLRVRLYRSSAVRAQALLPPITFPPSFTQRIRILTQATSHPGVWQWGTHRGTAWFTDQLWPLSLEVEFLLKSGRPFKFKGQLCASLPVKRFLPGT